MIDPTHAAVNTARLAELEARMLDKGSHDSIDAGLCVMEAVSYVAGEEWSDHPVCASPVIAAFMRRWNDDLDDAGRQMLKAYIPRLVGTRSTNERRRAWMLVDWSVRHSTPAWLELAGLKEQADALRALPELVSAESWRASIAIVNSARDGARSVWAAARKKLYADADTAGVYTDTAGAYATAAVGDAYAYAVAGVGAAAAYAGVAAVAYADDADADAYADATAAAAVDAAAAYTAADAYADAAAARTYAEWRRFFAEKFRAKLEPTKISLQASALTVLDRMIELKA